MKTIQRGAVGRGWLGAALVLAAVLLLLSGWGSLLPPPDASDGAPFEAASLVPLPRPASEPTVVDPAKIGPPAPELHIVEGTVAPRASVGAALEARGVTPQTVHAIATGMRPVFDFRRARAGDQFRLTQRPDGEILEFRYIPSPLESYHLVRQGDELVPRHWEAERLLGRARIASVITSSLYESIEQLGEDPRLAGAFADIFAWDVDFSRAVRPGDEFSILYERVFRVSPAGERVYQGPGRILAARYDGADGKHEALYFEPEKGQGGYYRPDGTSVRRQFLRAPLSYRRISSRYSLSRLHPILKVRRPHQGIDYAAPTGTPVWSVGDGRVVFRGRQGGFGNMVKIRHSNGYETWYGHLSGFAKGLAVGQRVSQKQVIGYVGSTGLATGPHLDFRMKRQGHYVNPARIFSPTSDPIPEQEYGRFAAQRDRVLDELAPPALAVTHEAL